MHGTYPKNRRDVEETATLVARVFAGRYDDLKRTFLLDVGAHPTSQADHWRVVRRAGRVVAHVGVYRKPVRIGCATVSMGGIGFVCCDPEFRCQGLAALCMKDALVCMREQGMPLSLLFGRDHYYGRFGYVGCLPAFTLKMSVKDLKGLRNPFRVVPAKTQDMRAMVELYNAAAETTPASVVRSLADVQFAYKRWQLAGDKKGASAVFLFREKKARGAVRAYAVWKDNSLWEAAMRPGDDAACAAVLAWVRDKRVEAVEKEVVLEMCPPAHPLWAYAERFTHSAERRLNWTGAGMGCIVDVPAFLRALQPEFQARLGRAGLDCVGWLKLIVDGRQHHVVLVPNAPVREHELKRSTGVDAAGAARGVRGPASSVLSARIICSSQALLQMVLGALPWRSIPDAKIEGAHAVADALFPVGTPAVYRLDGF